MLRPSCRGANSGLFSELASLLQDEMPTFHQGWTDCLTHESLAPRGDFLQGCTREWAFREKRGSPERLPALGDSLAIFSCALCARYLTWDEKRTTRESRYGLGLKEVVIHRFAFVSTVSQQWNNYLQCIEWFGRVQNRAFTCAKAFGLQTAILNFHGRPSPKPALLCPIRFWWWWLSGSWRPAAGTDPAVRDLQKGEKTEAAGLRVQFWVADGDSIFIFFPFENKQKMMWVESSPYQFTGQDCQYSAGSLHGPGESIETRDAEVHPASQPVWPWGPMRWDGKFCIHGEHARRWGDGPALEVSKSGSQIP